MRSDPAPFLLILFSFLLNLGWMYYANYTEEDAFITFRFAQQIAAGNGFVYNPGEPIYGSTTPLLTLLLAGWLKFISTNVITGARILNLTAVALMLVFTWLALKALKRSLTEQVFVLLILLASAKLIYMNTQGMETPLGLALLAASWYFWLKDRVNLTGALGGLLLWVRVDFILWILVLVALTAASNWRKALRMMWMTAAVYLPWALFAIFYFGSPVPFTVTAKWVAYSQFNASPYLGHLTKIVEYLSPFRAEEKISLLGAAITTCLAAWGLWTHRFRAQKGLLLPVVFILLEITRLTVTRATFFNRYFIPILWAAMILSGLGLGALWEGVKSTRIPRALMIFFVLVLFGLQAQTGLLFAKSARDRQYYRHDLSLKEMGLWLKNNSDPTSVILLEPLGYVGYYSERMMLDEVGLVTPAVVGLKRQRIGAEQYVSIFQPDYVIIHCDDTTRIPPVSDAGLNYVLAAAFNPLEYDENAPASSSLPLLSCYEIWKKE